MAERATTTAALIAMSVVAFGCDGETGARDAAAEPDATSPTVAGTVPNSFELVAATLTAPGADGVELDLWIAATPDQWHHGLTGVTELGPADGMLFQFDREAAHRFHMWQTPMPLDIFFFDSGGDYVGMNEMTPCLDRTGSECERYSPDAPFLSAIEVPSGALDDLDLDETWSLAVEPEPTPATTGPD